MTHLLCLVVLNARDLQMISKNVLLVYNVVRISKVFFLPERMRIQNVKSKAEMKSNLLLDWYI